MLWHVAKVLKEKRRVDGSLRLDMPKLQFTLDPDTQYPIGPWIRAVDLNRPH